MKINLGCGTDIKEGYLNLDIEPFEVVRKKASELQGRELSNLGYQQLDLDVYPYPFEDNSIDEILAFGVIEHIKDYRRCIEELKRILKVDGVIHIKVPHFTCAGSNSEFHKTRFWYHSFTANRLRKSQRTSGEASGLYDDFEQIGKKKINFVKGFLFWNYLIEPLINLHPFVSVLYEHTFICYLFPASEIEVELKKLHEENIKNDKYDADAHANCYPGY
ncbi:hypothetical protein LCGC14_1954580 [marine sediment metagenome]|uniref:Methyltransferase type 11 domain-containing protein n=1 Tax=marine sediment metagenome TaxID=412755 RepID=A0A0F9FGQ5_9ZZZZ